MAYEQLKRLIQRLKTTPELNIGERFLAGSMAGAISQSIIYPLEVLKTRLALRRTGDLSRGLIRFAYNIFQVEGLRCFYKVRTSLFVRALVFDAAYSLHFKGYWPNLLGIMPYAGIDLAIYETLKTLYLKRHTEVSEPGVLALLACGTCSSTCG